MSKTERLSHYGILLIGISALLVSVWQVQLSHHHNKLSVRPFLRLQINSSGQAGGEMKLLLSNYGQGPAIVKSMVFEVDGVQFDTIDKALAAAGQSGVYGSRVTTLEPDDIIDEKRTVTLLDITHMRKTKTIQMMVRYESLYGESFDLTEDY